MKGFAKAKLLMFPLIPHHLRKLNQGKKKEGDGHMMEQAYKFEIYPSYDNPQE